MNLRRYLQASATFAWPLGAQPLQEARDRYTVTGNPTVSRGPWGNALTLDGANDYVTLTAAQEDQLRFDAGTLDFSVVAWIRWIAGYPILAKWDVIFDGWAFTISVGPTPTFFLGAVAGEGPILPDAGWHCVAAVIDRSTSITVYTDGIPGTPTGIAGPAMATTIRPSIGYDATFGRYTGDIAGILVIPRILSPAECLGLAQGSAF